MAFDMNQLMGNPMFNMGLGLLSQPRSAPIGQGLLAGIHAATQQGLLARQRRKEEQDAARMEAQEKFFTGLTPEDIPTVYQKMLSVPGLGPDALKGLTAERPSSKVTYQQDAQGNIVALPETMPAGGTITPIQTGVKGFQKERARPWYIETDEAGNAIGINPLFKEFELTKAQAGAPRGGGTPYFMPLQTGQGVMSFNARTGRVEPVDVGGGPIIGAQYDPSLQSQIAGAKAGGKEFGTQQAKAAVDLPQTVQEASQTVGLVDDLLSHPGLSQAVGTSSLFGVQKVPGTQAKDFMVRLDQLKGKQFLQAYQALKGGGQITEVEGKKATDAISRMDNSASEPEFINAAREFQNIIRMGVERAKIKASGTPPVQGGGLTRLPAPSAAPPPSAPTAPPSGGWGIRRLP